MRSRRGKALKILVTCPCGIQFDADDWQIKSGKGKFCSKGCFYRFRSPRPSGLKYNLRVANCSWIKTGQRLSPNTEFQKGIRNNPSGEIKKGQRISPSTEFKKGNIPGNFKGDSVGYAALHGWVRRHLGIPRKCEHCGSIHNVQWANKTWKYLRTASDWMQLCFRCHRKYDSTNAWGITKKHFVMRNGIPTTRLV